MWVDGAFHPVYWLQIWWHGGRKVQVKQLSSSRRLARVQDQVTQHPFCMSRFQSSSVRPGHLWPWDGDWEDEFE